MEMPEQAAARRAIEREKDHRKKEKRRHYNETQRKRKEAIRAKETPEQRKARLQKQNEQCTIRRAKRHSKETSEQTAARRSKENERQRNRKIQEGERERRRRDAETRRKIIQDARTSETPEQRAARLLKQNERYKRRRQKLLSMETPEEAAARRVWLIQERALQQYQDGAAEQTSNVSKDTKRRKQCNSAEMPEEKAARRQKNTENVKKYREKKLAKETPEETAARKAKASQLQTARRALETPEKREARLQSARERSRKYFDRIRKERRAAKNSTELIHGDFNESNTWSSFGTSEGSFSITTKTTGGSFSTTTIDESVESCPKGTILIKNEPSQDSWSYCESSASSSVIQELFQDNRDLESSKGEYSKHKLTASNDVKVEREENLIYGAYIADRLRKCKRNDTEVNVAKNHIENIMFDLSTGAYSYISSIGGNDINQITEAPSLLEPNLIAPVVQAIIVKEEVDL